MDLLAEKKNQIKLSKIDRQSRKLELLLMMIKSCYLKLFMKLNLSTLTIIKEKIIALTWLDQLEVQETWEMEMDGMSYHAVKFACLLLMEIRVFSLTKPLSITSNSQLIARQDSRLIQDLTLPLTTGEEETLTKTSQKFQTLFSQMES